MKKTIIAVLFLAVLVVGMATAADPINATKETQGISSTTGVVVMGSMTDSKTVVMTMSNMDLRDNPPLGALTEEELPAATGPSNYWTIGPWGVSLPERQTTMSYTGSFLADNGYAEINGVQSLDTSDKVVNQENFRSTVQFDYVSFDDTFGKASTSESLLLDIVSQGSMASDRFICPFATGDQGFIPPYCNVYEMGSSFSGTQVSEVTQTSTNFIAKSADVPTEAAYAVGISGTGSASSWINARVMEGRTAEYWHWEDSPFGTWFFWNPDMGQGTTEDWETAVPGSGFMQGVDLTYKEKTTASGVIGSFSKSVAVQDGVRRL